MIKDSNWCVSFIEDANNDACIITHKGECKQICDPGSTAVGPDMSSCRLDPITSKCCVPGK